MSQMTFSQSDLFISIYNRFSRVKSFEILRDHYVLANNGAWHTICANGATFESSQLAPRRWLRLLRIK